MLTAAQQLTFRTNVKAQGGAIATAYAEKNTDALAAIYNALATPDYWIWRDRVTKDEFVNGSSVDGTTFSWTAFIARSQGERDAFQQIFMNSGQAVNPSLAQVRTAFADIFSGAPGALTRTHMLTVARKLASLFQKLYGPPTAPAATPATVPTELASLVLASQDVHDALFDAGGNPI